MARPSRPQNFRGGRSRRVIGWRSLKLWQAVRTTIAFSSLPGRSRPSARFLVMNIYILRHGLAGERCDPHYPRDADRPLTSEGKRKLRKIAKAIDALELSFDLILSSPYVRTRQTAEIIAKAFKAEKKLRFSKTLEPEGSQKELIQFLQRIKPAPKHVWL